MPAPTTLPTALAIFHGGEQSEAIATSLGHECAARGRCATLLTLDSFERWHADADGALLHCCLIVTTTEAGPDDLSDVCLRFLRRRTHTSETLSNVQYAVLGLGDSHSMGAMWRQTSWATAADCNQAARYMDDWLKFLGATRAYRRGESDERTDHEAVAPWIKGYLAALDEREVTPPSDPAIGGEGARLKGCAADAPVTSEQLPVGSDPSVVNGGAGHGSATTRAVVAVCVAVVGGAVLLAWRGRRK